ncbi:MAG: hypothetical protein JWM47_3875 [Acidimicrobiales bacterium]|nr:hypothetical protein [Acidimicrobiales bacterium]
MAKRSERPSTGGMRVLLRSSGALVALGGLGAAWVVNKPTEVRACQLAGAIDTVGAPTATDARARWAAELDLGIDVDRPDEVSGSGDRITAIYLLDRPEHAPIDPSRTYYRQMIVERDARGVWRVVDANRCTRWTE